MASGWPSDRRWGAISGIRTPNQEIPEDRMKFAITLSTADPETAFNALRLGNFARTQGDEVGLFLIGTGVALEQAADLQFDVIGQARKLREAGGRIMACGACLTLRESQGSEGCQLSTMKDLYALIRDADRVVSF